MRHTRRARLVALALTLAAAPTPCAAGDADARAERVAELNATLARQGSTCRVLAELPDRTRLAARCRRDEPLAETLESDPALCAELGALGFAELHVRSPDQSLRCALDTCQCEAAEAPDWARADAGHRRALVALLDEGWRGAECRVAATDDDASAIALTCLELSIDEIVARYVAADAVCPTWQSHEVATVQAIGLDGVVACDIGADCRCSGLLASGPAPRAELRRAIAERIATIDALLARGAADDALEHSHALLGELDAEGLSGGPVVAGALGAAARTASALGDLVSAQSLEQRALDTLTTTLGAAHPSTARARCSLGASELALGRAAHALEQLAPASVALGDALGARHAETLRCRLDAVRAAAALGDPAAQAPAMLELVAELEAAALDDASAQAELVPALVSLGRLELARGDADAAATSLQRARDWLAALPLERAARDRLGAALDAEHALGLALRGDDSAALEALVGALRALPDGDPALASIIEALGALADAADVALAPAALEAIAAVRDRAPELSPLLWLAAARWRLRAGSTLAALELADAAFDTLSRRGLDTSPVTLRAALVGSRAALAGGDLDGAVERLARALEPVDARSAVLGHAARARRLELAGVLEDELLPHALALRAAAPEHAAASALAERALLELGGARGDAALEPAPAPDALVLAASRLMPSGADRLAATRERHDALLARLTELEAEDPASVARRARGGAVERAALAAALPAGALLVVFAQHPDGVVAWTLDADASTSWHELGPRDAIDARIDALWRAADGDGLCGDDGQAEAFAGAATALHALLLGPIQERLEGAEHVLIVADGTIALAPLAALPDHDGRTLVERHRLSLLSSVRELVEPAALERAPGAAQLTLDATTDVGAALAALDAPPQALHLGAACTRHPADPDAAPPLGWQPLLVGDGLEPASWLDGASRGRLTLGRADAPLQASRLAGLALGGTRWAQLGPCAPGESTLADPALARAWRGLDRALALAGVRSRLLAPRAVDAALLDAYAQALAEGLGHADALRRVQLDARDAGVCDAAWGWLQVSGDWRPVDAAEAPFGRAPGGHEAGAGGCACASLVAANPIGGTLPRAALVWLAIAALRAARRRRVGVRTAQRLSGA